MKSSWTERVQHALSEAWNYMQLSWLPWLVIAACLCLVLLVWQLRMAADKVPVASDTEKQSQKPGIFAKIAGFFAGFTSSIRELLTPRAWCYKQAWYLFVGIDHAGRESVLSALAPEKKSSISRQEQQLRVTGLQWHFLEKATLLDLDASYFPVHAEPTEEPRESVAKKQRLLDWNNLVRKILHFRPERPLDGLIINLSARDLHTCPELIHEQLEALRQNLWSLEQQSSLAMPIYLLINECESVPGFRDFCRSLPEALRQQILGWSYQGAASELIDAGQLNEAMKSITNTIKRHILKVAASSDEVDNTDALMMFPHQFSLLQQAVVPVVERMMRPIDASTGFLFRGIYFTGQDADESACFLRELCSRKIFAERNIAYPTRQGLLSRDSLLRRYQIISALLFAALSVWMLADWRSLDRQLTTITHAIETMKAFEKQHVDDENLVYPLMREMSSMNAGSLARATIPASWGGIDEQISQYLAEHQFQDIIFPALEDRLKARGYEILHELPEISIKNQVTDVEPFLQWLHRLAQFKHTIDEFKVLSQARFEKPSRVIQRFSQLTEYLYQKSVPTEFNVNAELYDNALRRLCYPQVGAGSCAATNDTLNAYVAKYQTDATEDVFQLSLLVQELITANEIYQGALFETLRSISVSKSLSSSAQLAAQLLEFAAWYDNVSARWMAGSRNDPCGQITEQLALFKEQDFFGAKNLEQLDRAAALFSRDSCAARAREQLASSRYPQVDLLVTGSAAEELSFRSEIMQFRRAIADMQSLSFFNFKSSGASRFVGDDFFWDDEQLKVAANYFSEYSQFAAMHLNGESALRSEHGYLIRASVNALLAHAMKNKIASARLSENQALMGSIGLDIGSHIGSTEQRRLSARIAQLAKSSEFLTQFVSFYEQLAYSNLASELSQLNKRYALDLLDRVNDIAENARLYAPKTVVNLNFENLVPSLFGLGNAAQIKDYLFSEAQAVKYFTLNLANPILDFILANNYFSRTPLNTSEQALFNRWRETAQVLYKAENSQPDNSQQQLENFIKGPLMQVSDETCLSALPTSDEVDGEDLFADAQRQLISYVDAVCRSDHLYQLRTAYEEMSDAFNQDLSGRFPFSLDTSTTMEARLNDVHNFFSNYQQRYQASMQQLLSIREKDKKFSKQREFIKRIDAAAAFFAPNLTLPIAFDRASVGVDVTFRLLNDPVKQNKQIVHWALDLGTATLTSPGKDNSALWYFSSPVLLNLRWSEEADTIPVPSKGAPSNPRVNKRDVRFQFEGDWALLRFILVHRSPIVDPNLPAGNRAEVLVFTVDQQSVKDGKPQSIAQAYLGINLYGTDAQSGKRLALRVPDVLPTAAPAW